MDFRCGSGKLFCQSIRPSTIEVKCDRYGCGARAGIVVLHTFNSLTGDLISTDLYSEPTSRKEQGHATRDNSSVRAS